MKKKKLRELGSVWRFKEGVSLCVCVCVLLALWRFLLNSFSGYHLGAGDPYFPDLHTLIKSVYFKQKTHTHLNQNIFFTIFMHTGTSPRTGRSRTKVAPSLSFKPRNTTRWVLWVYGENRLASSSLIQGWCCKTCFWLHWKRSLNTQNSVR